MVGLTALLAAAYLGLLAFKALATAAVLRRDPPAQAAPAAPAAAHGLNEVAILQPILGGDPRLGEVLAANLAALPQARFVWLLDEDDAGGQAVADALAAAHPQVRIERHRLPAAAAGVNPKTWKLVCALPRLREPVALVLDDDARLGAGALAQMLRALERADVVTALPYYLDDDAAAGRLLAQFVNNNAAMTYLGGLPFAAPLTLNGMCYAFRPARLREWGGLAPLLDQLADDLALATLVRTRGGRLHQSTAPVAMRTAIAGGAHYVRQMHRWMLFARLLLARQRPATRIAIGLLQGLPPLLLAALLLTTALAPQATTLALAAGTLALRAAVLCGLQRRATGRVRHRPLLSLCAELLQPLHLLHATCVRSIRWRTRRYRVLADGRFRAQ